MKGGGYRKYCFLFGHLTPRVLARSGENTVRAAKDKDGVPTNHAQMISPACICTIYFSVAPDTCRYDSAVRSSINGGTNGGITQLTNKVARNVQLVRFAR